MQSFLLDLLLLAKRAQGNGTASQDEAFVCVTDIHPSFMLHDVHLLLTLSVTSSVCSPCWILSTGITSWR